MGDPIYVLILLLVVVLLEEVYGGKEVYGENSLSVGVTAGLVWFGVYGWWVGWSTLWFECQEATQDVKIALGVAAVTATPTTRSQAPATSLDKAVAKAALAGSTTTHSSRQRSHANHVRNYMNHR